jgi:hypothetical protein
MDTKSADGRMKVRVRFTSALVMRFKDSSQYAVVSIQKKVKLTLIILHLTIMVITAVSSHCHAGLLERVVAVVNDDVILHTELQEAVRISEASGDRGAEQEILEKMIERKLVLEQAKVFRLAHDTYDEEEREAQKLIDGYVESRIKPFIHVSFEEIENYHAARGEDFGGRNVYESWDDIENILRNEKLEAKLEEHVAALKKNAYIRRQLNH